MEVLSNFNYNTPHPLLIQHIVEKIFEDLPVEDLMNCRLVCKCWVTYTSHQLRKKRVIKILTVSRMSSYIRLMSNVEPSEFPDANYQLGEIESWSPELLTSRRRADGARDLRHVYHYMAALRADEELLEHHQLDAQRPVNLSGQQQTGFSSLRLRFFTLFGSYIKSLELLFTYKCSTPELRQILFHLTPNLESFSFVIRYRNDRLFPTEDSIVRLPNLKTLGIAGVGLVPNVFLRDLLIMAPNLERLTLTPPSIREDLRYRFQAVVFHSIVMSPTAPVLAHLNQIDMSLPLRDIEVQELTKKRFPLKLLNVGFCSDVRGESVNQLLTSLQRTLTRAGLNIHAGSPLARYQLTAVCEGLKHLSLCRYHGSLRILDNFPGLKSLVLVNILVLENAFPLGLPTYNLEELYMHYDSLTSSVITQRIVAAFPTLKTFAFMNGSDECLRIIYWQLPLLENLSILNGRFTDEGICGIPQLICNDIFNSKAMHDVNPGRIRRNLSIGNLTNLKKLRLEGELMTDASVILGVVSCVKLESLHLQSPQITDESLFKISKVLKTLTSLNVAQCRSLTAAGKAYVRSEMTNLRRSGRILETRGDIEWRSQLRAQNLAPGGSAPRTNIGPHGVQGQGDMYDPNSLGLAALMGHFNRRENPRVLLANPAENGGGGQMQHVLQHPQQMNPPAQYRILAPRNIEFAAGHIMAPFPRPEMNNFVLRAPAQPAVGMGIPWDYRFGIRFQAPALAPPPAPINLGFDAGEIEM